MKLGYKLVTCIGGCMSRAARPFKFDFFVRAIFSFLLSSHILITIYLSICLSPWYLYYCTCLQGYGYPCYSHELHDELKQFLNA